ncbi:MAG: hypothetical protein ACJASV_002963, partial [Pseudorhodobacter sp.]
VLLCKLAAQTPDAQLDLGRDANIYGLVGVSNH